MTTPPRAARGLRLILVAATAFLIAGSLQADVTNGDDKPGFIGRIFGGKKDGTASSAAAIQDPVLPPAQKPVPPRPRVTTRSSSGSSSSSRSASAPVKKSTPPAAKPQVVAKKETAPKTSPSPAATAASTASAKTTPSREPVTKDSEFGHGGDDADEAKPTSKPVVASISQAGTPSTVLPHSQSAGWEIVKLNGRDYITGESINRFYRFSSYKVEGPHVWLRSNNLILKGQIGSMDLLINNIKFVLSYPLEESNGRALFSRLDLCKLIDPVLRPSHISGAEPFDTVVVDAGHGGHDAGARGVYGYEKDFALKMAFAVRDALMQKGFKVVMTRTNDTFITLGGRVGISNKTPNSIFVSLHFNSGGSAASGIETFALTPQGSSASLERGGGYNASGLTGNAHDSANIALATAVHAMVISRFKFVDRGIKRAQWSVLTGCRRPGILFEGGFVTNGTECRLIASDTYRQSVSTAIADAVVNYRRALQPAVTGRR